MRDADGLAAAGKIILPGVGHFGQMMRALDQMQVREAFLERIARRRAVPGHLPRVCRLCSTAAKRRRKCAASAFITGTVRRFAADARVPHMGWNELEPRRPSRLLANLEPHPFVYFAHSYYVPENAHTAAACTYTLPYTAVLESGNVFGVQFHPEKSGPLGLRIVRNFVEL